jgi:hypothetical protein
MSIPPLGQNRPAQGNGAAQKRPAGIGASYALNPTPQGRAAGFIPVQPAGHTEVITQAPTLGQFWRSDIRRTTGGRTPRWAGMTAFWVGLVALAFLIIGSLTGIEVIRAIAFPLSFVAGFFALIALIAGIGRVLGFFGLLLALAGNVVVIAALLALFG